jgi:hypothetical protein
MKPRAKLATVVMIPLAIALTAGITFVSAAPALGQPATGYGAPPAAPPAAPTTTGAPAGFTTVLTTVAIGPAGGTVSAGGITVTIPAGDFTVTTDVSILLGTLNALTGLPAGDTPVEAVGVVFTQGGAKVTGAFATPITVSVANGAITTADTLDVYLASSGTYVPVTASPNVTGNTVVAGDDTFHVTADPYVVILAVPTTSAAVVPGATVPVTGVPVVSEGLLGGLLIAAGLLLAWRLRRSVMSR